MHWFHVARVRSRQGRDFRFCTGQTAVRVRNGVFVEVPQLDNPKNVGVLCSRRKD